jgi:7-cyano-7-deazaguanine synthase
MKPMNEAMDKALVLFSGGQDSATCLAWALDRFEVVETVGFDYGQRHRVELDQRRVIRERLRSEYSAWAGRLGDDHTLDLRVLGTLSESALTREVEIEMNAEGLPTTFVPGRNLVFLTFAAALAYRRGIKHIVAGMCETDYSGYPDCRDDTIKSLQVALNLGMQRRFVLHTPLMWIDKAGTWSMAHDLGGDMLVELLLEETHTCYRGDRAQRHEWGYGCGTCTACLLRADGFRKFASINTPRSAHEQNNAGN